MNRAQRRGAATLTLLILGFALIVPTLFTFTCNGVTVLGAVAWFTAWAVSPHHIKEVQK